ncbi:MAG: hypothetical protein IAG13_08085 [Deltaproteobacteria bacterium]|nr:hypothetical protein [Nannocystaceae bacterium]
MNHGRIHGWLAAAAAASALLSGVHCLQCTDIACDGGFEWSAAPDDASTLVPGGYELVVVLDGSVHEIRCTVAAGLRDSSCEEPVRVDGDADFDISVDLLPRQIGNTFDPDAPIAAILLSAAESIDDDPESSTRGPREVEIELSRDGELLVASSYEIEYVRDDDFRGDERCGFCDEAEQREASWTP